jgi:TonB family protein
MFTALIESTPRPRRAAFRAGVSLTVHLAAGAGIVHATRRLDAAPPPRVYDFVVPAPTTRPPPPATAPVTRSSLPSASPFTPPDIVLPPNDQIAPIPPADPGPPVEPTRFVPPGPRGPICFVGCGAGMAADSVFSAETVDQPAAVVSQPAPIYPPMLRAAGLSGRVPLEFTVDSTGRVEPGTIRPLEVAHPGFLAAAVATIEGSRFSAARVRGRAVRQIVRQTIAFRIEP